MTVRIYRYRHATTLYYIYVYVCVCVLLLEFWGIIKDREIISE